MAALRMKAARLREAKPLVQDHTAGEQQSQGWVSFVTVPVRSLATAQGLAMGPAVGPSR